MLILNDYICEGCGIIFEGFHQEDSTGNIKYTLYPKCTCVDVHYTRVGSAPVIHQKGYSAGDARYNRGNGR